MTALPSSQEIARLRTLIAARLGLQFDDAKTEILAQLLYERACSQKTNCTVYLDRLASKASGQDELQHLAAALTVTETYFLRNIDQLNAFRETALPDCLRKRDPTQTVQILSAGCASGEEPYSLAILAAEYFADCEHRIAITAWDINPRMLEKAKQARYTNWSLRECPSEIKKRWFTADNGNFILDNRIRNKVQLQQRNLAHPGPPVWPTGYYDIIFCRNVLMYFSTEQAQAVIARLAQALVPSGYFFLGHAETLRGLSSDFHLCHTHNTFYYQRKAEHILPPPDNALHGAHLYVQDLAIKLEDSSWVGAIQQASERIEALAGKTPSEASSPPAATAPDLRHAFEHLHRERFDQLLTQLESLPAEHAEDTEVLLLKAISLCQNRLIDAAEATCWRLLALDELNAGAHYILALCREGVGDEAGAIEHDQVASYLDPNFAMPRLHLGLLARRQRKTEQARLDLEQALRLLQQEDVPRLLMFGGGFKREALIALCQAEITALETLQ